VTNEKDDDRLYWRVSEISKRYLSNIEFRVRFAEEAETARLTEIIFGESTKEDADDTKKIYKDYKKLATDEDEENDKSESTSTDAYHYIRGVDPQVLQ